MTPNDDSVPKGRGNFPPWAGPGGPAVNGLEGEQIRRGFQSVLLTAARGTPRHPLAARHHEDLTAHQTANLRNKKLSYVHLRIQVF